MPAALLALACCTVLVTVRDSQKNPVDGATVRIGEIAARTGRDGAARVTLAAPGLYTAEISAPALQTLHKEFSTGEDGSATLEVLLPPASIQSVTVEEKAPEAGGTGVGGLTGEQMKRLPTDPPTLLDALPLIPGTMRTPEGRLSISSSPEYRSTMLLNSMDVTDPATGSFGATVPIDAVASFDVFKSPFLAEYGRFTQAVVTVDTKRGEDKWHAGLNDPTPELRLRSRRIRGVRGFTPRLSFSGPLKPGKLYLSQSGEYRLNKTPVFTQPFPLNETWRENWNSLTQVDWIGGARHALTATVHVIPQKVKFDGLNFYTPRPSTVNHRAREFRAGVMERAAVAGGVLESALSAGETLGGSEPQAGFAVMTLLPNATEGSYFAAHQRRSRRYQWTESFTRVQGVHTYKTGVSFIRSESRGWWGSSGVRVAAAEGWELERIDFLNRPGYRLHDHDAAAYFQDHVQVSPAVAVDAGVRIERQQIARSFRAVPRAGVAWAPFGESDTVFRAGAGIFYDRFPLSAVAFGSWPVRLEAGVVRAPVLEAGAWSPRSHNWSGQIEHQFPRGIRVRAGYLESRSSGLPAIDPGEQIRLSRSGRARYRQLEAITRFPLRLGGEVMLSYVRSAARGASNEFGRHLNEVMSPILRPNYYTTAAMDTPHRALLWGVIPLDEKTRLAPVFEYRSGLPWSPLDARQQYAFAPNSRRFPNFLSADFKVSRDVHVRKHAVQLSFSMFNVTNHWNPDAVRWNVADPQFGEFLGQHRRRFRVDFDYLF